MSHSKAFDVINACSISAFSLCSRLSKCSILACICHVSLLIHGKITNMQLIDHSISHTLRCVWILIICPAFRIGRIKIDDHSSFSIDTCSSGIRIACFHIQSVKNRSICVVSTSEILRYFCHPCTLLASRHLDSFNKVFFPGIPGLI